MINQIRILRERKWMTQADLARGTGLSQVSICRYESGEREPSIGILQKIARFLECSIDDLLADQPEG